MGKTVAELFKRVSFEYVWENLLVYYPEAAKDEDGYRAAWEELRAIEPKPHHHDSMCVTIEWREDEDAPGTSWARVYGLDGEERWAIMCGWAEWLGLGVLKSPIPESELAAHILWEMTFYGFTADDTDAEIKEIFGE